MRYDLTSARTISFGDIDGLGAAARAESAIMSGADGVIQRFPKAYDQMLGRRFEGGADLGR